MAWRSGAGASRCSASRREFMSRGNATVRYVADASYWIYLVHLPIVVVFQVLVGHLSWHWTLKFPLILAASFAVLFVSYRYLVRSTFIGQMLNGRRYEPQRCESTARFCRTSRCPGTSARASEPCGSLRFTASTSATARRSRSRGSTWRSGVASCLRFWVRTVPASQRRSRSGSGCSSPTRERWRCSAARRSTSRAGGTSA